MARRRPWQRLYRCWRAVPFQLSRTRAFLPPCVVYGVAAWDLGRRVGRACAQLPFRCCRVLFNDGGVDTTHPDLDKLDSEGSCSVTDGDSSNDYHGTICASIAVGNAGNGACSQGIAPGASLASCNMLTKTRPSPSGFLTLGVDNGANDISSNRFCRHLRADAQVHHVRHISRTHGAAGASQRASIRAAG